MNNLKKILRVLVTGSFTTILSACYGVMVPFSATIKVQNDSGNGIPKLKISYKDYPEQSNWSEAGETDISGEFQFSVSIYNQEEYNFLIQDTDGAENFGEFQSKTVTLDDDLENIVLTEK